MIHSMTAFARRERATPWGTLVWELRSVNHRYLELAPRLPEELRVIEAPLRERVAAAVQRGKVDCQLRWQSAAQQSVVLSLDTELAKREVAAAAEVAALLRHPASISALEILRWPGEVQSAPPDVVLLAAAALAFLFDSLSELSATRARVGSKLQELIA